MLYLASTRFSLRFFIPSLLLLEGKLGSAPHNSGVAFERPDIDCRAYAGDHPVDICITSAADVRSDVDLENLLFFARVKPYGSVAQELFKFLKGSSESDHPPFSMLRNWSWGIEIPTDTHLRTKSLPSVSTPPLSLESRFPRKREHTESAIFGKGWKVRRDTSLQSMEKTISDILTTNDVARSHSNLERE